MRRASLAIVPWCTLVVIGSVAALACGQQAPAAPYPPIEPRQTGFYAVSDRHQLYWELSGNPDGIPVLGLHGGPGASAGPWMRGFFDPKRFNIILYDQRGAGRSKPAAEWRDNTTQLLIEDIEKLLEHLGIEKQVILFGGSWGTTLALAYAEAHPERVSGMVLRGVFLATERELEYYYHGGAALFFPDAFEGLQQLLPHPERHDYPRQLFEMTQVSDPRVQERVAFGWAFYESRLSSMTRTDEELRKSLEDHKQALAPLAVLENYYMMNNCFLEEGQLLRDSHRIAHIPTFIVNGRSDGVCPPRAAWELSKRLKDVKLELPLGMGHSPLDPENRAALLRGVEWVADRVESAK
ncbi:MAG: prolyl aminopeptidase [Planctomycetota bacterium]